MLTGLQDGKDNAPETEEAAAPEAATDEVQPLTDITNKINADVLDKTAKDKARAPREPRERRERGPPADGIASKNKVMVANLPYDLTEEKVKSSLLVLLTQTLGHSSHADPLHSSRSSLLPMTHLPPRSLSAPSPDS